MNYQTDIPACVPVANAAAQAVIAPIAAPDIAAGDAISAPDVIRACEEEQMKEFLFNRGTITADELGEAKTRLHAIVAENAAAAFPMAGAPLWFQPALQDGLRVALAPIQRQIARGWNASAGDGLTQPWVAVSFVNGDDPTLPPHGLPPISNVRDLQQLPGAALNAYLIGHGVAPPRGVDTRRRLLGPILGFYGTV
jgi:hypothetical protein